LSAAASPGITPEHRQPAFDLVVVFFFPHRRLLV
jgi:hypothetical protein